jgi:hypothetical protein
MPELTDALVNNFKLATNRIVNQRKGLTKKMSKYSPND